MTEKTPKTLQEKLLIVQTELKAPKGQANNFGKYKYRSCEDIMEAVKPLLAKQGLVLIVSDELVNIGERYYVKATAGLHGKGGSVGFRSFGYAREAESKKGMDESQVTGAASSYARKYALNGLFLIDDTKDADTDAHQEAREAEPELPWWNDYDTRSKTFKPAVLERLMLAKQNGETADTVVEALLKKYRVSKEAKEALITLLK